MDPLHGYMTEDTMVGVIGADDADIVYRHTVEVALHHNYCLYVLFLPLGTPAVRLPPAFVLAFRE